MIDVGDDAKVSCAFFGDVDHELVLTFCCHFGNQKLFGQNVFFVNEHQIYTTADVLGRRHTRLGAQEL